MNLVEPFPLPLSAARLASRLGCGKRLALCLVRLPELRAALATGGWAAAQSLSPAELARYDGYTFEKRRLEWLGGRLAAKQAAATLRKGSRPGDWPVENDADGRPFYHPPRESDQVPALSISHSHTLAAALAVAGHPCGFDLQKVSDTVVRVREKFSRLSELELLHAAGIGPDREAALLTLLWAAKEALRKGLGGQPLPGFMAMRLARIEPVADRAWLFALRVEADRAAEHLVAIWWLDDFAAALTVITDRYLAGHTA
jgi:phosphopantetheinyl transferase